MGYLERFFLVIKFRDFIEFGRFLYIFREVPAKYVVGGRWLSLNKILNGIFFFQGLLF